MLHLNERRFSTTSAEAADDGAGRVVALSRTRATKTRHEALDAVEKGTNALDDAGVAAEKRQVALLSRGSGDAGNESGHDGGNGVGLHFVCILCVDCIIGVIFRFIFYFERARY